MLNVYESLEKLKKEKLESETALMQMTQEYHPLGNKNITVDIWNTGWDNILVEVDICGHKLTQFNFNKNLFFKLAENEEKTNCKFVFTNELLLNEIDNKVYEYLNRTIDDILEECYEECTMEELNEIANVWNESHNFEEWRDLEREARGI